MQTFTEQEALAAKMFEKVKERRKGGKEGLLDYIKVNPKEFDFVSADHSRFVGMFECIECNAATTICKHNPFLNGEINRSFIPVVTPESDTPFVETSSAGNFTVAPKVNAPQRKRIKREFSPEQLAQFVADYVSGMTIQQVADKYDVPTNYPYEAIKAAGVARPKGIQKGQVRQGVSLGRARSTQELTPELLAEALKKYHAKEGGVVAIAKDMNLAPTELSEAFKAQGIELKRGRQK